MSQSTGAVHGNLPASMRCCDPGRSHTFMEPIMQSLSPVTAHQQVITSENVVPLVLGVTITLCATGLITYAVKKTGSTEALTALAPVVGAFSWMLGTG